MAEDLRRAFVGSARDLADLMRRARCDANWAVAAERLKGLAATFGIVPLLPLAEGAIAGAPGDPALLRRVPAALDALHCPRLRRTGFKVGRASVRGRVGQLG